MFGAVACSHRRFLHGGARHRQQDQCDDKTARRSTILTHTAPSSITALLWCCPDRQAEQIANAERREIRRERASNALSQIETPSSTKRPHTPGDDVDGHSRERVRFYACRPEHGERRKGHLNEHFLGFKTLACTVSRVAIHLDRRCRRSIHVCSLAIANLHVTPSHNSTGPGDPQERVCPADVNNIWWIENAAD